MVDVGKAISTAVKTGKVLFGGNNAIRKAKTGKAKLIVIANNCPEGTRQDIEYYGALSGIPIFIYNSSSIDLGAVCGKPFMVSALTVREVGDSEILKLVSE